MRTTQSAAPIVVGLIAAIWLFASPGLAQQAEVRQTEAIVPRLVQFSGMVKEAGGKPVAGVTFALYKDQQGGAPVWTEMQNVALDENGRYSVLLGSAKPDGLPKELFASGEARWLGVHPEGEPEQPRVLLLSVPYALKAADAETVGGLPASAFVLAGPPAASGAATESVKTADAAASVSVTSLALAGSGTLDFIPLWTPDGSTLGNSIMFQSASSNIGIGTQTPSSKLDVKGGATIRGTLSLPSAGAATASAGKNSQPLNLAASAFSSSTATSVNETFRWQAEPAGNNTANPAGTLNLLFGSGTGTPAETGLQIASNGVMTLPGAAFSGPVTFAAGQAFPGAGTTTSVGLSAPATDFTVTGSPVATNGTLGLNWTLAPTSANTPNAIVKRDSSGNITAGIISAAVVNATNSTLNGTLTVGAGATVNGNLIAGSVGVGNSPATMLDVFSTSNTNGPMGQFGSFGVNDSNSVKIYNGSGIAETFQSGCFSCFVPGAQVGDAGLRASIGRNIFFGDSGASRLVLDSVGNALQTNRTAGGMVKAMVSVNAMNPPYGILSCFNSTLAGAAATTPPCGITLTENGPGDWRFSFGFKVDDRFMSATLFFSGPGSLGAPCISAGPLTTVNGTFAEVFTWDCGNSAKGAFFYLFIY